MLVAPVEIGDGAKTGAGSVVTRDIPPGDVAYGVPARVKATPTSSSPEAETEQAEGE
jgi:bifunctional UDP-N-acetylglucosamine pyrophosphorylase/glucosamine-1-phosphate N-acetyltransferase